jgi:hypothetical protein
VFGTANLIIAGFVKVASTNPASVPRARDASIFVVGEGVIMELKVREDTGTRQDTIGGGIHASLTTPVRIPDGPA